MRIINKTKYETRDIMKLVFRVAKDELNPGGLKNGRITINYRRNGGIGGWCYYGTIQRPNVSMRLNLPRTGLDVRALALVIAHELAHAKGVRHSEMNETRYKWGTGWQERYAYAEGFPIGVKAEPVKPTLDDKRTKALTKAQEKVREWETAVKRANTMLKKWEKKARTIERRLKTPSHPVPSESPRSLDASSSC
jgi:hypothetical protein